MMIFQLPNRCFNVASKAVLINNVLKFNYSTQEKIRVRFAPSPTGYLHLGGLRTALYNYLFAKKYRGTFILRIEDTDQTRKVSGAADALEKDLLWAGIEINEGPSQGGSFGSYLQSERLEIYREHINVLLDKGSAYRCFCNERRLNLLKREALKRQEIPKYDNRCRHLTEEEIKNRLSKGDSCCIRFKMSDQEDSFLDLIYGKVSYNIALNEGDPVILKSDGYPTYHFANVVDDHLMEVSHVLRGVEWQISTTKHIQLYRAFGWQPPQYGHLPLILNADGTKLSKRQGDIRIGNYRENGILPLALLNFIVHSGGGFEKDLKRHLKPHCYSIEELCEQFDLSNVNSHSGKLINERLLEYNRLELKRQFENLESRKQLINNIKELSKIHLNDKSTTILVDQQHIEHILKWSLNRISKLSELFSPDLRFIWTLPESYEVDKSVFSVLSGLKERLSKLEKFDRQELNATLKQISSEHNLKYGMLMKSLRTILSGLKEGPSIAEMIEILGKQDTIKRIELCLNKNYHLR
ncbi:hypothetical protein ABEB36_013058 [Hypothenemus hampei]|uniref:Nondiscriminating glutamyl-tRNA synthetase EARS2, mitochondrial n=1 Tax=Hypothenemus hampei TaxID=57062 RepID=A0ABD1E6P2_HYPHA